MKRSKKILIKQLFDIQSDIEYSEFLKDVETPQLIKEFSERNLTNKEMNLIKSLLEDIYDDHKTINELMNLLYNEQEKRNK